MELTFAHGPEHLPVAASEQPGMRQTADESCAPDSVFHLQLVASLAFDRCVIL